MDTLKSTIVAIWSTVFTQMQDEVFYLNLVV